MLCLYTWVLQLHCRGMPRYVLGCTCSKSVLCIQVHVYILLQCPMFTLCHLPFQSNFLFTPFPPHLSSTACNCSDLSVSGECDIVSGQCQCQAGAIGLKCDDCAFGFFGESVAVTVYIQIQLTHCFLSNLSSSTGTVPDCQQCHECFTEWYYRVQDIALSVGVLENRVQLLIELNYNGYTVESIMADVQELLDQLATANTTLQSITPPTSEVEELESVLEEVSTL